MDGAQWSFVRCICFIPLFCPCAAPLSDSALIGDLMRDYKKNKPRPIYYSWMVKSKLTPHLKMRVQDYNRISNRISLE